MSRDYDIANRPAPLRSAFRRRGVSTAVLGSVVSTLVTWGLLSSTQAGALNALLAAAPGAIGLVTALLSAFGVVRKAEPEVTPLADPVDGNGRRLTPEGT